MSRCGAVEVKKQDFFRCINWKRLEANLEDPPFLPDVSIFCINALESSTNSEMLIEIHVCRIY